MTELSKDNRAFLEGAIAYVILNGAKLHLEHGEDPYVTNSQELAACIVGTLLKNDAVVLMKEEFDEAIGEAFTRGQLSTLPD